MPGPSQQPPGVPAMIPPIEQCPREDIPEEVQRRAPCESLKDFQERYNAILNNITSIDDKIAYMAFFLGFNYGKLNKALVLETPLTKDELTKMVNKNIDLENLLRKEGPSCDLREKLS
ncbi:hypothetical protein LIER_40792 [Lithospermum erythrorhizon]|uniref:Uncharacterized protein n=1 Tax=Lithospermum erythrorhizon TaxID=34254 RepID=A0AAV3R0X2_LITER